MQNQSDRYVKKFSTYNHVVVMLFLAFEGYHSIREVVLGLLANAHKLSSCVLLEAFSCSLPVIAYNNKSPKDIIENGVNGFLVSTPSEMVQKTIEFLADLRLQENMKKAATERSRAYTSDQIITKLLNDTGLTDPA